MNKMQQVSTGCKNWLCNDIRAYILFSIKDEHDQHLLSTITHNIIKFRKGLPVIEIKKKRDKSWKLRVPVETNRWSSELEVKDIIKDCFEEYTLLNPPPLFGISNKI